MYRLLNFAFATLVQSSGFIARTLLTGYADGSGASMPAEYGLQLFRRLAFSLLRWWRIASLTWRFTVVAGTIVGFGMLILGSWVSATVKRTVVTLSADDAAFYMTSFIAPALQELAENRPLSQEAIGKVEQLVTQTAFRHKIAAVKIWSPEGRVIYSTDHRDIGGSFPMTKRLARALAGRVEVRLDSLDDEEHVHQRAIGMPLMEVYAPIRQTGTDRVIAVAEFYQKADSLVDGAAQSQIQSWIAVSAIFLAMMAGLFRIVQTGSRTIARQERQLLTQIDELTALLATNRELRDSLHSANRRLQVNVDSFLQRLSSELHDGPAQLIGYTLLRLDSTVAAASKSGPGSVEARAEVEVLRGALQEAMAELRKLAAGLYLPELKGHCLREAVELAVNGHRRRTSSSVEVVFEGQPIPEPTHALKACVYRFTQEALTNAYRHAPGAKAIVRLGQSPELLKLEVLDDGPGFEKDVASAKIDRLGIGGLRDRVECLGGRFEIGPGLERGTRLSAHFDVKELDKQRQQEKVEAA